MNYQNNYYFKCGGCGQYVASPHYCPGYQNPTTYIIPESIPTTESVIERVVRKVIKEELEKYDNNRSNKKSNRL
jgi:hypothetical protein